jgi:hypothetical protein
MLVGRTPTGGAGGPRPAVAPFDTRAALAATATVFIGLDLGAAYVGAEPVRNATGALLAVFGLPSVSRHEPAPALLPKVTLLIHLDDAGEREHRNSPDSQRMQALFRVAATTSENARDAMRSEILSSLLTRFCRATDHGRARSGEAFLRQGAETPRAVAWFQCGSEGEVAKLVRLDEERGKQPDRDEETPESDSVRGHQAGR